MSFHSRLRRGSGIVPDTGQQGPPAGADDAALASFLACYLDSLVLIERMHRLLLDVIKDEFERLGILNVNAVQALLLFNVADHEVTAGELKTRGYYQGSNVSYNLKKLVEAGLIHHTRCEIDRRSVRVRLTDEGQKLRGVVSDLFQRHARLMHERGITDWDEVDRINAGLRRVERFWVEQIRYIY